jgi:hypothetical protein
MSRAVQRHQTEAGWGASSTCRARRRWATGAGELRGGQGRACRASPRRWRSSSAGSG